MLQYASPSFAGHLNGTVGRALIVRVPIYATTVASNGHAKSPIQLFLGVRTYPWAQATDVQARLRALGIPQQGVTLKQTCSCDMQQSQQLA